MFVNILLSRPIIVISLVLRLFPHLIIYLTLSFKVHHEIIAEIQNTFHEDSFFASKNLPLTKAYHFTEFHPIDECRRVNDQVKVSLSAR